MPSKNMWVRLVCVFTAIPLPVLGAQWTTNSGISPEVSYTDNVCLSAEDEQGEFLAVVSSNLRVGASGRRASFDIGASVDVNSLSDSKLEDLGCRSSNFGNRKQIVPRVNANAQAELWEDWLFLDADVNVDQNEANPFLPGGGDSLNRTGNTNTFVRYTVSPYITHRFSDFATLQLRYTLDDETNTEDIAVSDSGERSIAFDLASNEGAGRFSWGLQANSSKLEYEETAARPAEDSELSSVQLNLGYQLNRYWQVNGSYGEEDNDFVSSSDEIDGDFWDVGVRWTPNSRTTADLGFGDRFFGTTPRVSVNHVYRRSTFSADYSRDLTYDRNIRGVGIGQSPDDNAFLPRDPVTGLPVDVGGNRSTLSTSPIIDERFTLGYVYSFRRATLNVNATHSEQSRTEDQGDRIFQSLSISVNRSLSRSFTLDSRLRLSKTESQGERDSSGRTDNELVSFNIGVRRPLNSSMDISLDYEYESRRADVFSNEYDENRVSLSIQIRL